MKLVIAGVAGALLIFAHSVVALRLRRCRRRLGSSNSSSRLKHHADHEQQYQVGAREEPAIFLSHSGHQKPFVESLDRYLRYANHVPFFDQLTLPKASPFPALIRHAALGCKLGVVVLSHEYLTSKWPMLELELLVLHNKTPNFQVFPLFYKLSPQDLKSPRNLSKWRQAWKKFSTQDKRIKVDAWERALKALGSYNGEVYISGTSEAAYIDRVVSYICKAVPSHAPYDLREVRGHQFLAQEVLKRFEHAKTVLNDRSLVPCTIALHGVGGLGKTTICKIMANFFNSEYSGRSAIIELPSDGNVDKIVIECKRLLKKFVNINEEHLLDQAHTFDQVVQLLNIYLGRYGVFIAIDNIWENTLEEARRIMQVKYGSHSKILLTSRSEEVLKDLLKSSTTNCVGPLPSLSRTEALLIFQDSFQGDLSFVQDHLLDRVLRLCRFENSYHALALRALGQKLKRVTLVQGGNIELQLSQITLNLKLGKIEDVIQSNFMDLSQYKQHMFLDIVMVLLPLELDTYQVVHQWLSFLYKEYSKDDIADLIYQLALDGLIHFNTGDSGSKVKVHDLYIALAKGEAVNSSRFLIGGLTKLEDIDWRRLARVVLPRAFRDQRFSEELELHECPKLEVLISSEQDFKRGIYLDRMPSLCVLYLESAYLKTVERWTAACRLAVVRLWDVAFETPLGSIPTLPCLEALQMQYCGPVQGLPHLHGCHQLKELDFGDLTLLREDTEFKDSYFSSLTELRRLFIRFWKKMKQLPRLSALGQLQTLEIERCHALEGLEGMEALQKLQSLSLTSCPHLKNISGLSALVHLKSLKIFFCSCLTELSGLVTVSGLESLSIYECTALQRIPNLNGLSCLRVCYFSDNASLEEIEKLPFTLKDLDIDTCTSLKDFSFMKDLVHLQSLRVQDAGSLEQSDLPQKLENLQRLTFCKCRVLPCFDALHSIINLCLDDCESLKDDRCLTALVNLEALRVSSCRCLQTMTHLGTCGALQYLEVMLCGALTQIGDLSELQSLRELRVSRCASLKSLKGFISTLNHLEVLWLDSCESLTECITDFSVIFRLKQVHISSCGTLETFPFI